MTWYLLRVFGRRVLVGYAGVALLLVALLAALHFVSRYGLQLYIRDQLGRIPWDITLYQMEEAHRFPELRERYRNMPEASRVAEAGLLRVLVVPPLSMQVDDEPVFLPWLVVASATDGSLLPPELRAVASPLHLATDEHREPDIALALIGPQERIRTYLSRIREGSRLRVSLALDGHGPEDGGELGHHEAGEVFSGRVSRVGHIERQELIKWLLREIGSVSFVPTTGVVVSVPIDVFTETAQEFQRIFRELEHDEGPVPHQVAPNYLPEVAHLISLRQEELVSPWDLEGSIARLRPIGSQVYGSAWRLTPFVAIGSDLLVLLDKMATVARLVNLATLLIAIPLLWVAWVLAANLGRLIVLNERRLMGLARLRGIPMARIQHVLLLALILGGIAGGVPGLIVGIGLPWLGYRLSGGSPPPGEFFVKEAWLSVVFLVFGVALAVLSGMQVMRYVRQLTPREAIARIVAVEEQAFAPRFRWYQGIALVVGGYKLVSWIIGFSPLLAASSALPKEMVDAIAWFEGPLNFAAIPLFLYGLVGLLAGHIRGLQRVLAVVVAPVVTTLGWFVARHMSLRPHRVASLLLMAALVLSVSLSSQVSADTFHHRAVRGAMAHLGADLSVHFNVADLTGGELAVDTISHHLAQIESPLSSLRERIGAMEEVSSVEPLIELFIPGFYVPGQSGLALYLLENPERYLATVYHEDSLGMTRPFPDMVRDLAHGDVIASQGLYRVRRIPLGAEVALGNSASGEPVRVPIVDLAGFVPGMPSLVPQQREGYLTAEVDYLNHLLRSQAYLTAARANPRLADIQALPSRVVLLVKARSGADQKALADVLANWRPVQPAEVRSQASERDRVGKDMFVMLALENMKIYIVGGILLALIGVLAVSWVNFLEDRRTFALLRVRGVPLPLLLRTSLAIFFAPVLIGLVVGTLLGTLSGYGFAQAIWDLPRVRGGTDAIGNQLALSPAAWAIGLGLSLAFGAIAASFGVWLFRKSAREALREG